MVLGSTSGGFTEWSIPTASSDPIYIAFGSGVVFTESASDKIGMLTLNDLSASVDMVQNAQADWVWVILGDRAGTKHSGVGYASPIDWTAIGPVEGMFKHTQKRGVDSGDVVVALADGKPKTSVIASGCSMVLGGGPGVNAPVHYYEAAATRQAPVYYESTATDAQFRSRGTGTLLASLPFSQIGSSKDMFVIESFVDSDGRYVLILYGFGGFGTWAAGTYYKYLFDPSATHHEYRIYRWEDAASGTSQNGIPDKGDTYTYIAGGNPP
jgi:hypothetical protein